MCWLRLRAAEQEAEIPLVRNGQEYVPDIATFSARTSTCICSTRCTVRRAKRLRPTQAKGAKPGINLLTSLELIQGSTKVYETPVVQAKSTNVEGRDAVAIEMDVPLNTLKAGTYRVPVERD